MDAYQFMNGILTEYAEDVLRDEIEVATDAATATATATATPKKKIVAPPTTTEGILKQKMRSSPRNIVTRTI